MNLGDVVGQLMREGLSPQTRSRIEHAAGGGADSSGGLGQIIGSMLGGQAGGQGSGGLGGLLGGLGSLLGGQSTGGISRGQAGGIGDLVGSLLGGGGGKGAVGGSAMALLGTLALSVLKNWQAQAGSSQVGQAPPVSEEEMRQIAAPETAELCLRGMIEAVKADGEISQDEVQRIVGKLQEGGITAEEKQFVEQEMRKPHDLAGLVSAIPNQQVGVQVYAAALMAISVDTPAERNFLQRLASGVGLDREAVAQLHRMVGAPAV
jgi:uncharacterized membrane protein YebE (DUF533 family)